MDIILLFLAKPLDKHGTTLVHITYPPLIYMGKNIQKIEEQLNSDFTSPCEWFIDNKLSVHFGEEKTKSILF